MTNKTLRILLILIWCLLHSESQILVLICLWYQHKSKNQVLGNHYIYLSTYWMLNQNHKDVVLWLQNQNADPLKLVIASVTRKNWKGYSKINEQIKRNMYIWITRHHQVFQSPISNDCLKVMLDDQTEPQLVPIFYFRCP